MSHTDQTVKNIVIHQIESFVKPHQSIELKNDRRQARLIRIFLIVFLFATFIMAALPFAPFQRRVLIAVFHIIIWGLFFLSRTKYYKLAGLILVLTLSMPPIILTVIGLNPSDSLRWLVLSILLGGLWLSFKVVSVIYFFQMAVIMSLPMFKNQFGYDMIGETVIYLSIVYGLIVVWSFIKQTEIRDREKADTALALLTKELELQVKNRTTELTKTNQKLKQEIEERLQAEKYLKKSEEKFRSMMESMVDPIYICSSKKKISYMNPAMVKRIGRNAIGENCFEALHNKDKICEWCVFDNLKKDRVIERTIVSPLDNRTYRISNMPIFSDDNLVSKMTIYKDITDFLNAVSEKEKAQALLERAQRLEAIGTLAGGIAHDFN
ncbi:MAG: hypothetical protein KKE61_02965, partial [Proteobacteria bacterium]|nr:hypothetical protein [Pseudomonadota bacterium]